MFMEKDETPWKFQTLYVAFHQFQTYCHGKTYRVQRIMISIYWYIYIYTYIYIHDILWCHATLPRHVKKNPRYQTFLCIDPMAPRKPLQVKPGKKCWDKKVCFKWCKKTFQHFVVSIEHHGSFPNISKLLSDLDLALHHGRFCQLESETDVAWLAVVHTFEIAPRNVFSWRSPVYCSTKLLRRWLNRHWGDTSDKGVSLQGREWMPWDPEHPKRSLDHWKGLRFA